MDFLVGFFLPPVVELVNKDVKSDTERFLVAFLVCVVVAVLLKLPALLTGNTTGFINIFLLIFWEMMTVFKLYWKDSFSREWLQKRIGSNS